MHRFPGIRDVLHAILVKPELARPLTCFFLGSKFLSAVFPSCKNVPSFFDFVESGVANPTLRAWLDVYCESSDVAPFAPQRRIETQEERSIGRSAGARVVLRQCAGQEAHIAVPLMGAVLHEGEDALVSARRQLTEFASKLTAYVATTEHCTSNDLPALYLHGMTALPPDVLHQIVMSSGQWADIAKTLSSRRVRVFVYAIKSDQLTEQRCVTTRFEVGSDCQMDVPIEGRGRNLRRDLTPDTFTKGTALYLALSVAHAFATETGCVRAFVGYTVATPKIPLSEMSALIREMVAQGEHEGVAIGSRRLSDSIVTNKPILNHLRSALNVIILRMLFPDLADVRDFQASCKLFTPLLLKKILTDNNHWMRSRGPECDAELLQLARIHRGQLIEVPIAFHESAAMQESLGIETGAALLAGVLEMKRWLPDLDELPIEEEGVTYRVIGSGTEHVVFRCSTPGKPHVVVKVPHEAFDTTFYLPLEGAIANALRPRGLAPVIGKTGQHELVGDLPGVSDLLAAGGVTARVVAGLRGWQKFNGAVLRGIRAVEGKDFKSTGYAHAASALNVVPFRALQPGEQVQIVWRRGTELFRRVFDDRDHVLVMEYVDCTLEDALRDKLAWATNSSHKTRIFRHWVEKVYDFSTALVKDDGLFDLDTNGFADIGESNGRTLLLDPGELVRLRTQEEKRECLVLLADRLGINLQPGFTDLRRRFEEAIGGLDYEHRMFRVFQFRQLDGLMDSEHLSNDERASVHDTCTKEVQSFLRTVLVTCCDTCEEVKIRPQLDQNFWCVRQSPSTEPRPTPAQVAAANMGSGRQGRYHGTTTKTREAAALCYAPDFAVSVANRGLHVDLPTCTTLLPMSTPSDCLYVTQDKLQHFRVGAESAVSSCDWSFTKHPFSGSVMYGIGGVYGFRAEESTPLDVPLVLLDSGRGLRTGPLAVIAGSKGQIRLHDTPLWRHAALGYRRIVDAVRSCREDLVVFGSADVLLRFEEDSTFLRSLPAFLTTRAERGRMPGLFFFDLPADPDRGPLLPVSIGDQVRWLGTHIRDRISNLAHELPGVHLFESMFLGNALGGPLVVDEPWYPPIRSSSDRAMASKVWQILGEGVRSEIVADAITRFGGLRQPFLYILSKDVIMRFRREFFREVPLGAPSELMWHDLFASGFRSSEEEFVAAKSKVDSGELRRLHKAIREIREEWWTELHRDAARSVSEAFTQDLVSGKAYWHGLEGPAEIFGVHLVLDPTKKEGPLCVYGNSTLADNLRLDPASARAGVTYGVVIAGENLSRIPRIELAPPDSDVAARSNLFPYLIYPSRHIPDVPLWRSLPKVLANHVIRLPAQSLCLVHESADGYRVARTKLGPASKHEARNQQVEVWDSAAGNWSRPGLSVQELYT
jgi:hypothetical protein